MLQPAIDYALNGYPVSEVIARGWEGCETKLRHRPSGVEMLPVNGRAPKCGEMATLRELGGSLQVIAEGGSEAYYKGDIGKKIAAYVQQEGGWLTEEDIQSHHSDWDEAIHVNYRGVEVWECPPNGQGIAALMALNIAEGFDIGGMGSQSADAYHHLIESMRLGYEDALQYVADPRVAEVPIGPLLEKEYGDRRRSSIDPMRAHPNVSYGDPMGGGDTIYCTAVDGDGNACSLINSLFAGFGSGLVVPGTGIALQNRGSLFSFDPDHPNYLVGGKRPYQTIIPAMATRDDEMWLSFGVMGGFQQPQGHLQVVSNMVDFGMDSQKALDALRFSIDVQGDKSVKVEEDLDASVVSDLRKRGHDVVVQTAYDRVGFGGGTGGFARCLRRGFCARARSRGRMVPRWVGRVSNYLRIRRAMNSAANMAVIRSVEACNGPFPFELHRPPELVGSVSGDSVAGAGSDGGPSTVVGWTMTSGSSVGVAVGSGVPECR